VLYKLRRRGVDLRTLLKVNMHGDRYLTHTSALFWQVSSKVRRKSCSALFANGLLMIEFFYQYTIKQRMQDNVWALIVYGSWHA